MTASIKETLELKPCPFCGSAPILCDQGDGDFAVTCKECGAGSRFSDEAGDAAKAWNTRVTPASLSCGEARERIARAICQSGRFDTGEGTCAVICMDQLGDVRKKGCGHCTRVHGKLADAILATGCVPGEAASEGSDRVEIVTYTNWRGETSVRRIIPKSVRFGSTKWHPEPQWLLLAWDDDKQADREFALKDFGPSEASIRADEREKCAEDANGIDPKLLKGKNELYVSIYCGSRVDAAAAIRAGRGEG